MEMKFAVTVICVTALLVSAMKYGSPLALKFIDAHILDSLIHAPSARVAPEVAPEARPYKL